MSAPLVRRVRLRGPALRGDSTVAFEAPVFIERNGLALHPAWSVLGPEPLGPEPLGPLFVISATSCGWRVGAFASIEQAEAAFLALEALPVQWHLMGPRGTARYPAKVRADVVRTLEKHGAQFQRRSRRHG